MESWKSGKTQNYRPLFVLYLKSRYVSDVNVICDHDSGIQMTDFKLLFQKFVINK